MSLLKQIEDKGAVLEWSPIRAQPNIVALGTKDTSGVGFDDFGGELELHSLDFTDFKSTSTTVIGKTRASSRFSSIAWSEMAIHGDTFPLGLVAGGMVDGNIHVWDPAKMAEGEDDCLLASMEQHQGAINGLHFNPHKESSHLLASGGSDCEVFVTSIEHPDQPSVFIPAPPPNNSKHTSDITKVAWNTQVAHILASASQNGSTFIWDLRQKKTWCELRDPSGGLVSDVAWNPDQGLHLVTASGDDKNPVLKLWDLRSSTSLPLATLQGHTEGVLSLSWCPNDSTLLMSCGKDNKTIMWDLFNLQPVYELPVNQAGPGGSSYADREGGFDGDDGFGDPVGGGQSNLFGQVGGSLASNAGRRHHVSWSPHVPGVVATCSFDRRVQVHSLIGAKSKIGRAPKWLKKPMGAAFGFGGKLATFDNNSAVVSAPNKKGVGSFPVKTWQVIENEGLVNACDKFHDSTAQEAYKEFCSYKTETSESIHDQQVWSLMSVICFGSNAREELLTHLGFDSGTIMKAVEGYIATKSPATTAEQPVLPTESLPPPPSIPSLNSFDASSTVSAEDMFGAPPSDDLTPPPTISSPPISPPTSLPPPTTTTAITPISPPIDLSALSPDMAGKTADMVAALLAGEEAEPMIRKAIIVGNFEAAVECCLQAGLLAEALLLAQCGEPSLRVRTQAAFFEKKQHKHPFLSVLHAVIKNELMAYVMASDLSRWRETLALLSTYGKSDEFPILCETLANRLEAESKDPNSATLCYMCAANMIRTIEFWTSELKKANEQLGYLDTMELQNYVEKVSVFTRVNTVESLGPECSSFFTKYAELVANEGRLDIALSYLKGESSLEISILIDRLYHAGNKKAGSRAPAFPFVKTTLEVTNPSDPANMTKGTKTGNVAAKSAVVTAATTLSQGTVVGVIHPRGSFTGAQGGTGGAAAAVAAATAAQYAATASTSVSVPMPIPTPTASILPAGWIQLVDPTSGHTYYVDQATGQSQWEAPVAAPTPTPIPTPAPIPVPVAATTVSSMQQPMMQPHFSQPQSQVQGQAQAMTPEPAASSSAAYTGEGEDQCIAILGQLIENTAMIASSNPVEKKQVAMIRSAYTHLLNRQASRELSVEVMGKLSRFVDCIVQRNFNGASTIQTDLANTAWGQHKEWIKGIKILLQLSMKSR